MAIEKSYVDMIKERDVKIEALKELLKLSYEKLGSQSDMITELAGRLSHAETMSHKEQSTRYLEQRIKAFEYAEQKITELHNIEGTPVIGILNYFKSDFKQKLEALKSEPKVSSEGEFWVGLEESLNQEEALKEQE